MKKKFIILLLLFITTAIFSRNYTICGYVRVSGSNESLINCSVFDSKSQKGTTTNNFGFYSIVLNEGHVEIKISCVGYQQLNTSIVLHSDTIINFNLDENLELNELTVTANRKETGVKGSQLSTVELPVKLIKSLPAFLGETDVIKTLQMLPGVQGGMEGSSGFYTRGGGPDENLFLLDGVPLYNVNHMAGFFSVFNSDAVKSITLYKGGFPARFGGRLSSVVDVRTNDGNTKKISGSVSLGLISSKLNIEGPLFSSKTTFNLSLRRSYLDLFTRPLFKMLQSNADIKADAGYYFYDINLKLVHRFTDNDQLFFSNYLGNDILNAKVQDQYDVTDDGSHEGNILLNWQWGNMLSSLRWNHILGNKLFMNTTATFTNYGFKMMMGSQEIIITNSPYDKKNTGISLGYNSGIQDYSIRTDFDYSPVSHHEIKFGIDVTRHIFKPGVTVKMEGYESDSQINDTIYGNESIPTTESGIYFEDNIQINKFLKANFGIRYSFYEVRNHWFQDLQPRLSLRVLLNEKLSIKTGFASMTQYIHMLSYNNFSLPNDLWVPATENAIPMKSVQYSTGIFYNLFNQLNISIEGYYKSLENLIEYTDGATFFGTSGSWENKIVSGNGWSYGVEFLIEKTLGKTTGWIGYTWSVAQRKFDKPGQIINNGQIFPAKYDRPNDLNIVITHRLNDKIELSGALKYSSGNRVTLALQDYKGYSEFDSKIPYFINRNNYRLPDYFRIDAGINFHKKLKSGDRTWMIGIYNATNQMNPFYIFVATTKKTDPVTGLQVSEKTLNKITIFPIIPSVSYIYKF